MDVAMAVPEEPSCLPTALEREDGGGRSIPQRRLNCFKYTVSRLYCHTPGAEMVRCNAARKGQGGHEQVVCRKKNDSVVCCHGLTRWD